MAHVLKAGLVVNSAPHLHERVALGLRTEFHSVSPRIARGVDGAHVAIE